MSPTGPLAPTTIAQDSSGIQSWSNLNNAKVEDGSVATVLEGPGGGGGTANELLATGFGFNIPTTAIIDGIKLEIKVQTTGGNSGIDTNPGGTLSAVYLLFNGGNTNGTNTPNKGQLWPLAALTWLTYGSSTSLWGKAWTAADINNANFGAAMAAFSNTGTATLNVDAVRITVYWHTAPATVTKRYDYLVYNSGGQYLGNLPTPSSDFQFSQDINTAGGQITIVVPTSADTSSQPNSHLTNESGNRLTDENSNELVTDTGAIPIVANGNSQASVLIKNGNSIKVVETSFYYPNGKTMFLGEINRWEANFGGDSGDDTITILAYSDGADLDNYIARGAPFTYTTDQSQVSNNSSETINTDPRLGFNMSGQTWTAGAGVTNLGAITLLLNGTANVTINIWDSPAQVTLLGTITQAVSVGAATAIQFGLPIPITTVPGASYFFGVSVDSGQSIVISYQNTDVYVGGQHYTASYGGGSGGGTFGAATGDLYFVTASSAGSTTGTYTSQDPTTGMLEPILTDYQLRGGLIQYNASSIDATGLSLTYTFNTNTIFEAVKAVLSMSPNGFYFYVDMGADILYFKQTSATPDFYVTKGNNITQLKIVATIESIKNQVYFSGGVVAGSNIYTTNQSSTSIGLYGVRLDRMSDNRVTDLTTAKTIALGNVARQKDEQYQTQVTVLSTTMDTTLLTPGKVIGFNGFGTFVDNLTAQIVHIDYYPDYVTLTLGILPKRLSPAFEAISRGLVAAQTVANPSAPS